MTSRTATEQKRKSFEEIEMEEKVNSQKNDENDTTFKKERRNSKMFYTEFESVYNFVYYFPNNNALNVVRKLNSHNLLNLSTLNSANLGIRMKHRGGILRKGQFLFKSNN